MSKIERDKRYRMRERAKFIRELSVPPLDLDRKIERFCEFYGWEAGVSEFGLHPETAKTLEIEALRAKQEMGA